jgi:hypothetical protein
LDTVRLDLFEVVQRPELGRLLEENESTDPVWQELCQLILRMGRRRHSENVVEFFQGTLLGFWAERISVLWQLEDGRNTYQA